MRVRLPMFLPTLFLTVVLACTSEPRTMAFVETLGNDTMTVETFTRTAEAIEGRVIVRSPSTRVATYHAALSPEGAITGLSVEWTIPGEEGQGDLHAEISMQGDSATMTVEGGQNPGSMTVATAGPAFPEIGQTPMALGIMDHIARRSVASGEDEFGFSLVQPGRPQAVANAITRLGSDSVSMDFFGSPIKASIGELGGITGRTGEATTLKMVARAVDPGEIDIDVLAADFAARDARGEGLGVASPTVEVPIQVAGANFQIRYSQPAKRGRDIFGGLVPWRTVWRTGANAATHFTTDRDLEIGGASVPAGTYTLFSVYTPDEATLIINSQTNQWGTVYDESQDFVRVPMTHTTMPESTERFTISIEPDGDGAVMKLAWDHDVFSVPVRVR